MIERFKVKKMGQYSFEVIYGNPILLKVGKKKYDSAISKSVDELLKYAHYPKELMSHTITETTLEPGFYIVVSKNDCNIGVKSYDDIISMEVLQ